MQTEKIFFLILFSDICENANYALEDFLLFMKSLENRINDDLIKR